MAPIFFVTGNKEKLANARVVCEMNDVPLEQVVFEIDEIQGEDSEAIVTAKAWAAYEALQKPVVVSDDTWSINALGGFPGAYMKSINYWFKPQDFLNLLTGAVDRTVWLRQYLAYCDGTTVTTFLNEISGRVLEQSYGDDSKAPWMNVTTLEGDDGKPMAEIFRPDGTILEAYKDRPDAWKEFIKWYKERYS